jgi:hypothetical protein
MSVILMLLMMLVFFGVYEFKDYRKTHPHVVQAVFSHPGSDLGLTMADGGQKKEGKK